MYHVIVYYAMITPYSIVVHINDKSITDSISSSCSSWISICNGSSWSSTSKSGTWFEGQVLVDGDFGGRLVHGLLQAFVVEHVERRVVVSVAELLERRVRNVDIWHGKTHAHVINALLSMAR